MTFKLPRSFKEAVEIHPGIASIDDERPWMERDPDGTWPGPPLVCNLEEGWEWDGFNHFGFGSFKELRQEFNNIYRVDPETGEPLND